MLSLLLPTIVTLLLLSSAEVRASPCLAFDVSWNLLAFGLDGKDWNAGTQNTWASGTAADITASGRPPFNGNNTACFLAEYSNAIYVLDGDKSSPSDIHIYDATAKSWTKQTVTAGTFDPTSFNAILDHDTNVFYALSHGELYHLDMGLMKSASSSAIQWVDVEKAPYPSSYEPVMALAQNHIFFLNVAGVAAGSADIYVIHYNYFQPLPQAFPTSSGGTIPATHGKTASFFQTSTVQETFAFVPDDGSATYVLDVQTNTSQVLAGPTSKDPNAMYFASTTALVQLDTEGDVYYLLVSPNDTSANSAAKWNKVTPLANAAPPTGVALAATNTASISGTAKPAQTSSSSSGKSGSKNDASPVVAPGSRLLGALVSAAMLACTAVLF